MSTKKSLPTHVAIIMDGNGRWAKLRGKERYEGHIQGVESVRRVVRAAADCGVKHLTLYAFSTENWGRPAEEVEALMSLFCSCVINETPELIEQGVKVSIIGSRDRFSKEVNDRLNEIEQRTAEGKVVNLILALDYSSREEITKTIQHLAAEVVEGRIKPEDISEQMISNALYTAGVPDPDLVIRTSGECRLSNFLLWQASYAEFYFPQTLWPDFTEEDFREALEVYASRERRYGIV